jgi:LytS/YehU family sensor histidine kinase
MLYETDDEKVLLSNEAEYLQNYIELQRLRFNEKLILYTEFTVTEKWQAVEPMLLIPFVENAFKHCTELEHKKEIDISLNVKGNVLDFCVRNTFNSSHESSKDKTSGIGLANVKRRLELLYAGNHDLHIEDSKGWYTVHLKLKLK